MIRWVGIESVAFEDSFIVTSCSCTAVSTVVFGRSYQISRDRLTRGGRVGPLHPGTHPLMPYRVLFRLHYL